MNEHALCDPGHMPGEPHCRRCGEPWPCEVTRLRADLEEVRGMRDDALEAAVAARDAEARLAGDLRLHDEASHVGMRRGAGQRAEIRRLREALSSCRPARAAVEQEPDACRAKVQRLAAERGAAPDMCEPTAAEIPEQEAVPARLRETIGMLHAEISRLRDSNESLAHRLRLAGDADAAVATLQRELDDCRTREAVLTDAWEEADRERAELRATVAAMGDGVANASDELKAKSKENAVLRGDVERAERRARRQRRRAKACRAIYESAEADLLRVRSGLGRFVLWARDDLATRSRGEWVRRLNDLGALAGLPPETPPDEAETGEQTGGGAGEAGS